MSNNQISSAGSRALLGSSLGLTKLDKLDICIIRNCCYNFNFNLFSYSINNFIFRTSLKTTVVSGASCIKIFIIIIIIIIITSLYF